MDLLHIILLGVIALTGHQLILAFTQGRIYGRSGWFSYAMGWIYAKQQSGIFYTTAAIYSIGLIGAILVLTLKVLK
ncbi:MAG: hypothetical protein AAF512_01670 [Pseudomonadota bacterium]